MDQARKAEAGGCGESVAWAAANLISPAAALPGAMIGAWIGMGPTADVATSLSAAVAAFVTGPFTGDGLVPYGIAFLPCVLAGTTMMAFASVWPICRSYFVWVAVGILLGAVVGLMFAVFSYWVLWPAGGAGAACALVYRLIMGFAMPTVEQANPSPPPSSSAEA